MESNSKVLKFFNGKHVFLTGGNGVVGEVFVEKLLRYPSNGFILREPK